MFIQILDEIRVCDAINSPPESILLCQVRKTVRKVRKRAINPIRISMSVEGINSKPMPFQIFHASLGASIRLDIVVGFELSVDNINESTDFEANVVTSLLVMLGTLVQILDEPLTSLDIGLPPRCP